MVLAGWNSDESCVELLDPPAGSEAGDKITVDGFERKPVDQLKKNSKKNEFFQIVDKFRINEEGVACWDGHVFKTDKGLVTVPSI